MLIVDVDKALEQFRVPEAVPQVLHDQVIDDEGPGTILRDFETILEFVGNEGLASPGKYFLVPQSTLDKLNALMSCPVGHQRRHSGQLDMFAQ